MKKILGLTIIVLSLVGCQHSSGKNGDYRISQQTQNQNYVQVQHLPEMSKAWESFRSQYSHATAILIPEWCKIEEINNPNRGYFFPLYFLQHNSVQNQDFFNSKHSTYKINLNASEWAKNIITIRKGKVTDIVEIPEKRTKVSEHAYIFYKGATVSYISADGKSTKDTILSATVIVYSNGIFSNAMMTTTVHNISELMKYESELLSFVDFLKQNNIKLPKCIGHGMPGKI